MIRSLIIDDEQNCIDSLAFDLQNHCKEVEIVESCTSPKLGLVAIRKQKPDLVFLDVQMPWMNGFEMLEVLEEINFAIIFTTAYDQFAARAFRLSAIDYLLKPIDEEELKKAIDKSRGIITERCSPGRLDHEFEVARYRNSERRPPGKWIQRKRKSSGRAIASAKRRFATSLQERCSPPTCGRARSCKRGSRSIASPISRRWMFAPT